MKLSILSLGDHLPDPLTGIRIPQHQRVSELLALGRLADGLGFHGFHLGEHHFCDYIVSNPVPLLAAVAAHTRSVRLSTGVSLLANRDPVLVAEDYAMLDLISGGRAELVAGRGNAFFECYRQMGHDMARSRGLFEAGVDLLLAIWRCEGPVSSDGAIRPALDQARVQPRPLQRRHPPVWIGGGSSEDSVRLAVRHGLGLQLPGVFAPAPHFAALAHLYRELWQEAGWTHAPQVGFTAHAHVRPDSQDAKAFWEPYHLAYLDWVWGMIADGARGAMPRPPPATAQRAFLDPLKSPALCGSPAEVTDRLLAWSEALGGIDVMLLKIDGGGLPFTQVQAGAELLARAVAPAVASCQQGASGMASAVASGGSAG
jgi:alkanesulfonate monooxygenase SsuD/methylene tetrahydromethanopterin reductase-like flavin-dependent oxidoreductase (luciferase family)